MNKKIFGFDLGVASIGWAVVDLNDEDYNIDTGEAITGQLIDCGAKTFLAAENPKNKESLAKPRRDARLKRRTTRRKARRMVGIKKMFVALGLTKLDELEMAIEKQSGGDVWSLRVKALSEKLEKLELLRVLIHLAKHKGFKSYRKAVDEKDEDSGKVLKAIKANIDNKDSSSNYITLAQMIVDRAEKDRNDWEKNKKRNTKKNDKPDYMNSIPRGEIIKEVELIYNKQKQYGIFNEKLFNDYTKIAFRHRDFSSVEKMIGDCIFEKNEKRAAKESISAELFVALTKINNCKIIDDKGIRSFTDEEREETIKLLKTQKKVTYLSILNNIFQKADVTFKDIDYSKNTKIITKKIQK